MSQGRRDDGEHGTPDPRDTRRGAAGLLTPILIALQVLAAATSAGPAAVILKGIALLSLAVWAASAFAYQRSRLNRLASLAAVAAVAGAVGLAALCLSSALPVAEVRVDEGLSERWLSYLQYAFLVLFSWGILGLGTESLGAGTLPRGATILWMVGLLASVLTSWPPASVAAVAGIIWSSASMLKAGRPRSSPLVVDSHPAPLEGFGRQVPLDALRGTIMALMAIDHASFFVRRWHPFEAWDQPLPDYPDVAAMLTRLVTHPCAPGFFFLMGAGMLLFAHARQDSGWSSRRIAGQLALRGLLLIGLEQVIVDLATAGRIYPLEFSILAGLGAVMLLAILFLRMSAVLQAAIGAGIVLGMQVLPGVLQYADLGAFDPIRLLLLPGAVGAAYVLYPPIPWLGVALLGMAFARLLLAKPEAAYRWALAGGLVSLALFPLLRLLGGFGNLRMPAGDLLVDFLNVVKYPPSLSFLFLALGIDLVLLYVYSRIGQRLGALATLGRAALYFFLVHWFVYGALSQAWPTPAGLPETYFVWALGLVLLYPVCRSFEAFKRRMPATSVWRMI